MSARPYALLLLLSGAVSAAVLWYPLATGLVGAAAALLLAGFHWRRAMPTLVAGFLLYAPLALALAEALPALWSYILSALYVIVVCERMTFEYELSEVLRSPTGIDVDSESKVAKASREHAKGLAYFVSLSGLVMAGAAAASYLTVLAPEFIAAGILLMLVLVVYSRR